MSMQNQLVIIDGHNIVIVLKAVGIITVKSLPLDSHYDYYVSISEILFD